MQPLRIRIDRIVDFGTVVSLVGIDTETATPVTIHVDHRPFAAFWKAWWEAGFPQPVEYEADRLMLHLDMLPADDAEEVQLVELDPSGAATANDERHPVQEFGQ
jgi:hypothetical protein